MRFEITQRDKKLLGLLGLFFVLAVMVFLVIVPLYTMNEELKRLADSYGGQIELVQQKAAEYPKIQKEYETCREYIRNLQKDYHPMYSCHEIDGLLTESVIAEGLVIEKLHITMPEKAANVTAFRRSDAGSNLDGTDGIWIALVDMELRGEMEKLNHFMETWSERMAGSRIAAFSRDDKKPGTGEETVTLQIEVFMSRKEEQEE